VLSKGGHSLTLPRPPAARPHWAHRRPRCRRETPPSAPPSRCSTPHHTPFVSSRPHVRVCTCGVVWWLTSEARPVPARLLGVRRLPRDGVQRLHRDDGGDRLLQLRGQPRVGLSQGQQLLLGEADHCRGRPDPSTSGPCRAENIGSLRTRLASSPDHPRQPSCLRLLQKAGTRSAWCDSSDAGEDPTARTWNTPTPSNHEASGVKQ
jgi:hypothetical protein